MFINQDFTFFKVCSTHGLSVGCLLKRGRMSKVSTKYLSHRTGVVAYWLTYSIWLRVFISPLLKQAML